MKVLCALALVCFAAGAHAEASARVGRSLLATSPNTADAHPWGTLLANSFFFYEAQQSGALPSYNRARRAAGGWRDNAHMQDGQDIGADLTGGFYDAGDHMKYHVPMTSSFSSIGLGALIHEEGYRGAKQWDYMARIMKHAADYLVKAHLVNSNTPSANVMVVQIGDTSSDHSYWGRPEQQTGPRPTKTTKDRPASDVMGQTASVFASTAMILSKNGKWKNTTYANDLIGRARNLLAAADAMPGTWSDAAYSSSNYKDEVAMGYLMVCKYDLLSKPATLPATCKTALARYITASTDLQWGVNWDWDNAFFAASSALIHIAPALKAANGGVVPTEVSTATAFVARTLGGWQDTSKKCDSTPAGDGYWGVCYTPGGMPFLTKWGTLRHASNIAFAATLQATALGLTGDLATARKHRCWARGVLTYAAGTNPAKQSYIVGYTPAGCSAADRPHHRSASCDKDYSVSCTFAQLNYNGPSPNVLKGALVGGPNNLDQFDNVRTDYVVNEVALDYNAGFTGALAGTYLTTGRLVAAGCNWNDYCAGKCDSAAQGPDAPPENIPTPTPSSPTPVPSPNPNSPSPVPTPTPTPTPTPVPTPTPAPSGNPDVDACVASVPASKSYPCKDCAAVTNADVRAVCYACPKKTFSVGGEWACTSACVNAKYFTTGAAAQVCVDCLAAGQPSSCTQCLPASDKLAAAFPGQDISAQTQGCLNCAKNSSNGWACAGCLTKSTIAQVNACLACVAGNTLPAWQC